MDRRGDRRRESFLGGLLPDVDAWEVVGVAALLLLTLAATLAYSLR